MFILQTQFDKLKEELETSAKSQQRLVEEIDCLKSEKMSLLNSVSSCHLLNSVFKFEIALFFFN